MRNRIIVNTIISLPLFCLFYDNSKAQNFTLDPLFFLPAETRETSGLIFLNDKIITINDSGNDARLFEINPESGELERDLLVENAANEDWEDLTFDQEFIYIADIGNNSGDRLDLKIYRISLLDYFQSTDGNLSADSISFNYQDQNSFEPTQFTNFDAEALIAYDDSLYIFTKNWLDQQTNIYSIPKLPGDYEAKRVGRINAQGLVAGAAYNQAVNEILLVGYNFNNAFLVRLSEFEAYKFDQGKIERLAFDLQGSQQVEAIGAINDTEYFITTEGNAQGDALLLRLVTDFVVGLEESLAEELVVYPNPAFGPVRISLGNKYPLEFVSIYNMMGAHVYTQSVGKDFLTHQVQLDLGHLPHGYYQMRIISGNSEIVRKLVISKSH